MGTRALMTAVFTHDVDALLIVCGHQRSSAMKLSVLSFLNGLALIAGVRAVCLAVILGPRRELQALSHALAGAVLWCTVIS